MADSFAIVRRAARAFSFTGAAVGYEQRMSGMAEGGEGGGSDAIYKRQRLFKESVLCDCGKSNCPPA